MNFAMLALVCLVALLGPIFNLPRRVAMPVVIGELLVGIALGRSGFGILDPGDPTFAFLAEVGFAMVMFSAGVRVPLKDPALLSGLRVGALRAGLVGLLAVPTGLGLAMLFDAQNGLLLAVILASSSAGLVVPALGRTKIAGPQGMQFLAQLVVADIACIVAIPLAAEPDAVSRAVLGTLAVAGAAAAGYLVLRLSARRGRELLLHNVSRRKHLALELRIELLLLFALCALAQWLGISVMLAGFLCGLAVAAIGQPKRASKQLFGLDNGFFGPIFFVWIGASMDMRVLGESPKVILFGLALGLGAIALRLVLVATGMPLPMAVATAAQLGVPIGAVAIATRTGTLAPGEQAAYLMSILVTVIAVIVVDKPLKRALEQSAKAEPRSPSSLS